MNRLVPLLCLSFLIVVDVNASDADATGHSIRGLVVDSSGDGVAGVMVSAIDDEHRKWTSVFTQKDGSFQISGLRPVAHNIRTRLM